MINAPDDGCKGVIEYEYEARKIFCHPGSVFYSNKSLIALKSKINYAFTHPMIKIFV